MLEEIEKTAEVHRQEFFAVSLDRCKMADGLNAFAGP